ncbi:MAG: serine hydrolase [Saprospiraceae bacterium]|nr:serine hydrolase [Saprospiraceae bacterium]
MRRNLFNMLLFLLSTHVATAQTFDAALGIKLQNAIDSMKIAHGINGISASVLYPEQGMWKGVAGNSHAGTPINSDMAFGIASNTKLFTGVLLLKLAENGIIKLNDSLHEWLPTYANINPNITIRQLLNHTSGIADVNSVVGYADSILLNPNRIYSPNEVITWVGPPLFAAGTGWSYSNTNYILAAMVAESATGQGFGQLLRDSILSPLQLDSTFLDVYDSVSIAVAHPWQGGIDKFSTPRKSLNSVAWSAGGMYSTSGEMAAWYQALMSGQVLNASSFDEMTTFVGSGNYGIGLVEATIFGRTVWQHGGNIWGGYNSMMMYDVASNAVICVLINQNPSKAALVAQQLLLTLADFTVDASETAYSAENPIIFPNPTNGDIHIGLNGQKLQSIKVFNPMGEFLAEHFTASFSIANLPCGVYIVSIQTNEASFLKKLIKQ